MMTQGIASTIRDRGQLTIPDELREQFPWLSVGAVVEFVAHQYEVKIQPYNYKKQHVDWKRVREAIALARSLKGKRGNLSSFIAKDRQSH